ncbi:hypothetical protein [Streptomyces sp. SID3343]|uniref:hypothetical protein n=1 Tax=Streptomyces sp. SID3343 TaxID=2690260 RepID=UPI00136959E3|nr:hypothetical protein [Streptomyces sp. SID3343]MYV96756.1 hypothetical protein [Streptomyces sp. SID3343]
MIRIGRVAVVTISMVSALCLSASSMWLFDPAPILLVGIMAVVVVVAVVLGSGSGFVVTDDKIRQISPVGSRDIELGQLVAVSAWPSSAWLPIKFLTVSDASGSMVITLNGVAEPDRRRILDPIRSAIDEQAPKLNGPVDRFLRTDPWIPRGR